MSEVKKSKGAGKTTPDLVSLEWPCGGAGSEVRKASPELRAEEVTILVARSGLEVGSRCGVGKL